MKRHLRNFLSRVVCFIVGHQWYQNPIVFADGSRRRACALCPTTKKIKTLKGLHR